MEGSTSTGAVAENNSQPGYRPLPLALYITRPEFDLLMNEILGGHRRLRKDRQERDWEALQWIGRCCRVEGRRCFRSTLQQAATGLGLPTTGDRDSDVRHFQMNVRRRLDRLADAGLIRWGGRKRPNGQWWCIEIEVLDGEDLQRTIINVMETDRATRGGFGAPGATTSRPTP